MSRQANVSRQQRAKTKVGLELELMPKATKVKFSKDINTDMNQTDVLMATVYIKGGEDVQVPVEELADYLHNNADKIETRHREVRRKRLDAVTTEVQAN